MKIVTINGKEYRFVGNDVELTYEEICSLAFPPELTVTVFHRGEGINKALSRGMTVKLLDHMVINVANTGNA